VWRPSRLSSSWLCLRAVQGGIGAVPSLMMFPSLPILDRRLPYLNAQQLEVGGFMLGIRLDHELEWLLEHDVNDLARYNILRYLRDHPDEEGDVQFFAEKLGLRSLDRTADDFEALARRGLLLRVRGQGPRGIYRLSPDPASRNLVERLYELSLASEFGEIMDRLASRSLKRARRAATAARGAPPVPIQGQGV
jgi:hypothetical protein